MYSLKHVDTDERPGDRGSRRLMPEERPFSDLSIGGLLSPGISLNNDRNQKMFFPVRQSNTDWSIPAIAKSKCRLCFPYVTGSSEYKFSPIPSSLAPRIYGSIRFAFAFLDLPKLEHFA
jgi:hypothetical protein